MHRRFPPLALTTSQKFGLGEKKQLRVSTHDSGGSTLSLPSAAAGWLTFCQPTLRVFTV
jgi:hypothetical protein